jgi:uncharacterized protein
MIAARAPFLALLMCWAFTAFAVSVFSDEALADVAVPPLSGRVVDQTGTLSSDTMASLTQVLRGLELRKGSQVAVLIVPTTAPETIEQYSIRVAEAWKIGRKKIDDGALLVVAKDDHKLRIEVGYGLEGALTDVTSRRIIDEIIVPRFKAGDFSGGISAGVDRMIGVIDGEPLPVPKPEVSHNNDNDDTWLNLIFSPFGLLGYAAVAGIMRHLLGRLLGAGATAGVVGVFIWFVLGSIVLSSILGVAAFFLTMFGDSILAASQNASRGAGRGGSGGWSGGGGGWSGGSSSSSSDSGGFSGGGGSFGGGGASGSW